MSQYGPPGGPYPGQEPQRWPDGQPPEQYREPSDPWGGPEQHHPGYGQPQQPDSRYQQGAGDQGWPAPDSGASWQAGVDPTWQAGADPTWQAGRAQPAYPADPGRQWTPAGDPGRPRKGGGSTALVAVVAGLTVLLCGGGAIGYYLMTRPDPDPTDRSNAPASSGPEVPASPRPSPPAPEPEASTPVPTSSTDARFVREGQCVRNEGAPGGTPKLVITECDDDMYEVLARFDGATDGEDDAKTKCADVDDYTNWYFFNSELDALDFVLCLKER